MPMILTEMLQYGDHEPNGNCNTSGNAAGFSDDIINLDESIEQFFEVKPEIKSKISQTETSSLDPATNTISISLSLSSLNPYTSLNEETTPMTLNNTANLYSPPFRKISEIKIFKPVTAGPHPKSKLKNTTKSINELAHEHPDKSFLPRLKRPAKK